ncbi:sigma-54-dependent transcriptional regulator [Emticicia agri]|uniref:Sigma-54-dependent Fis family transcriptional regulator n=1 Tax=Emticicia agri TaxID=2492393 RepID=A0A4Q5LXA8_9BACT|nr:sigma-54 dependent transcriptional regulator [Emticicia agri]RYU94143.1 sigma-54-dependent Fis family transcriptional regulator [Emticicia agri]
MQRILVIDDDTDICLLLRRFLSKNGYEVAIAQNGQTGLSLLEDFSPDLVMTDFRLGDLDGGQILRKIKERFPEVPVLIITGYSDIKIAIDVMKQGAFDYITKPLFPDEILLTIKKALSGEKPDGSMQTTAEKENGATKSTNKSTRSKPDSNYIFGNGPESKNLYRQIDLVAPTNYSVIIYGESGSGKESIAQEIHKRSKRANGPFIAMDCGAISKELAASEMFGHEKGSFTGALNQKIGHFEMANGGTLFLDEVANLPYDVQVALLRVVQERKLRRIGGNKEISVDVRILVASNERLMESCRKGKFREDLYHRFNEFSLDVPPLRDRKADILEFAQFFLETTNAELGKDIKGFDEDVKAAFLSYPWYGNLREMRNVVKRSTLLSDGDYIESKSLPFEIINYSRLLFSEPTQPVISEDIVPKQEEPAKPNLKSAALDAEYEMILQVLKQVNYNKSKAAQVLSIDRKTLYNKMKSYNL